MQVALRAVCYVCVDWVLCHDLDVCVCPHDVHFHAQRCSTAFREPVVRELAALLHRQQGLWSRDAFSCGLVRGLAVRPSHSGSAIVDRFGFWSVWGCSTPHDVVYGPEGGKMNVVK